MVISEKPFEKGTNNRQYRQLHVQLILFTKKLTQGWIFFHDGNEQAIAGEEPEKCLEHWIKKQVYVSIALKKPYQNNPHKYLNEHS